MSDARHTSGAAARAEAGGIAVREWFSLEEHQIREMWTAMIGAWRREMGL